MVVSPKELFNACYGRYAIAAVNVFTMEQVLGLFHAGQMARAPFLIQFTPVARNYAHPEMLSAMVNAASEIYPDVVYAVHLDHGNEVHALKAIASNNYQSVMIDASHEDFKTNVRITKNVVEKAHESGIFVEAELGVLSGVEDDLTVAEKHAKYTNPEQVEVFVSETGCDSLAIAVGTSHGAYKFTGAQRLQFNILKDIQERLPGYPLVLHGGSAVNPNEVKRINAAGGQLKSGAAGVPEADIARAISLGVCKINIATDARLLWTRIHREFFMNTPEGFDPVVPGREFIAAFSSFMVQKFELLGAQGKAAAFTEIKSI